MNDDDRIKALEATCAALEKRLAELEASMRASIALADETFALDGALDRAKSPREVAVVGVGSLIRPMVASLTDAQRVQLNASIAAGGSTPADFLVGVKFSIPADVPADDEIRATCAGAERLAKEYAVTWADLGFAT